MRRGTAAEIGDDAGGAEWDEDPVREVGGLLDRAERVAGLDRVAYADGRREFPTSVAVECRGGQSARDHRSPPWVLAGTRQHRQRSLRAVEDRTEQTGAELCPERLARVGNRLAGGQPRCVLVDLDHGVRAVEPDHLPGEARLPDLDDVVEARRGEAPRDDHRPGNAVDLPDLVRRPGHAGSPSRSKVIW